MFWLTYLGDDDRNSSSLASSKDDITRLRTITLKVGEFLFVKDDENNQITSVCLSATSSKILKRSDQAENWYGE